MNFYTRQHKHYCGIDLHARAMYVCILDQHGTKLVHKNLPTTPEAFLRIIAPYREDLVVAVECIFTWYWLADLCEREGIAFVLGHALYMKAIHGGKAKNDKIDAHKIAVLLRGGMLPQAYVYPAAMRATRDLLRRRCPLVRKRAALLAHIHNTNNPSCPLASDGKSKNEQSAFEFKATTGHGAKGASDQRGNRTEGGLDSFAGIGAEIAQTPSHRALSGGFARPDEPEMRDLGEPVFPVRVGVGFVSVKRGARGHVQL